MFKSGDKDRTGSSGSTTLISRETQIEGDINFSGNLDIEGSVRGRVTAFPGKEAVIRVVDKGYVEGEIQAPSVIINGHVVADVHSSKHLSLGSRANVSGNLYYHSAEMALGAKINGTFRHVTEDEREPAGSKEPDIVPGASKPTVVTDPVSVIKA